MRYPDVVRDHLGKIMLDYKPIYWFSGLYLQPQHLQT